MIELDNIQNAIIHANDEWENSFYYNSGGEDFVKSYCQQAYLSLLTFADKNNLIGLRDYLIKEWKKYEKDLLDTIYSESADSPFLKVTSELLYPVLVSLGDIYEQKDFEINTDTDSFSISRMIELLPHTATKLEYQVLEESSLDDLVEAFLTPIYPDLNSNPALTLPEGYRQPDSAIPSLDLLLEYKFLKNKGELRRMIDEIQADIRNYAQDNWKYFYIIIGMDKAYITKEKIERTLLKEPSSFKKIRVILLKF